MLHYQQDLADVAAATENWLRAVTGQKPTSPAETSALYAQDAVLWATVSPQLRVTPREIQDYFEVFARLPQLTITNYKPYIRVYGDVAINDGYYTVSFAAPDGTKVRKSVVHVKVAGSLSRYSLIGINGRVSQQL